MCISSLVRARFVHGLFVLFSLTACTVGEDTSESNSETEQDEQPAKARDGGSKRDASRDGNAKGDAGSSSSKRDARTDDPPSKDEEEEEENQEEEDDDEQPSTDGAGDDEEDDDTGGGDDGDNGEDDPKESDPDSEPDEETAPSDDSDDGAAEPDPAEEPGSAGAGEVITTKEGTKIYVDPSCENLTQMIMGRSIELVGCCAEATGMCGLSTHKLMIPEQFASMFPHKCRGYEELSMFMLMAPAPKSCTIPK